MVAMLALPAASVTGQGAAAAAATRAPATAAAEEAACAAPAGGGPLSGHVIVVDPGHGLDPRSGGHTGAHGVNGAWEDDNALDIGCRLVRLLSGEGATVYITRGSYDPGPPPVQGLIDRVRFAENHHAQVFVSIHENASGSGAARGVAVYYTRADSRTLAQDVEHAMTAGTGLRSDGVLTAPFYVTRQTTMPAVLVEGGFLTNAAEAALITTPAFHQKEAQALDQALLTYFGAGAAGTGQTRTTPSAVPTPPSPPRTTHAAAGSGNAGKGQSPGAGSSGASPSGTAGSAPAGTHVLKMVATAYGPSLADNFPYGPVDAFGKALKPGDVAVDPRVIPLNTRVYVTGYTSPYLPAGGFSGVARDTGGAIKGDRIDLFIDGTPSQVAAFGIQDVKVTILG